jgi:protein associated with RNAse G/E
MLDNTIQIISYKHNGVLHRVWQYAYVIRQTSDVIVVVNDHTNVIDGDGRRWKTKEPAVCYYFKKYWFNVICMLRNNSIYYYCNLSSPYVKDSEGLKYIDYDLDVKVFPSGDKIILDRDEFDFNKVDYNYSEELINIIENELKFLLDRIDAGLVPFNSEVVLNDYKIYCNLKNQYDRKKKKTH